MPRISPWGEQYRRPQTARKAVPFPDGSSITLRAPDPGDRGVIRDRQDDLIAEYVSGAANADGQPLKLMAPEMPPKRVKMSRDFCYYAAALMELVEIEEGDEPLQLLEIVGWRDNLEKTWEAIRKTLSELYVSGDSPDPNAARETEGTGNTSASP